MKSRSKSDISTRSGRAKTSRRTVVFLDHTAMLGGGEIALFNLVMHLDTDRFEPVVVLCSDGPLVEKLREAGIETHVLPLAPSVVHTRKDQLDKSTLTRARDVARVIGYAFRLARFLKVRGAWLLHCNSLKADVIGALAGRLCGVPVLWHVRDRIAEDYLRPKVARLFRFLCRVFPRYVITNSAATMSTLELPRSENSGPKRSIVHDGIAVPDRVLPSRNDTAKVGIVGRISPWKGQHIFLDAAKMVKEEFPQTQFQIIGSALFGEEEYEAQLRQQASAMALNGKLEWLGFRDDVPELIAQLQILVHASTVGEPFGQVVIEGMVAGKPVVATRGGGVPEIVEDGVNGVLVPMNDAPQMAAAICDLLRDPISAQQIGQAGYQRVRDAFSIEDTARKVELAYSQIEK